MKHLIAIVSAFVFVFVNVSMQKAHAQQGGEYCTHLITNPGFDDGTTGWTLETTGSPQSKISTGEKGGGIIPAGQNHWQLWKGTAYSGTAYQTIYGLPDGNYTIGVAMVSSFSGHITLFANSDTTEVTSGDYRIYTVDVDVDADTLKFGITFDVASGAVIDFDEFTLLCNYLDGDDVLEAYLHKLELAFEDISDYLIELSDNGFEGVALQLAGEAEEIYYTAVEFTDTELISQATEQLKALVPSYKVRIKVFQELNTLIAKADYLINTTSYPGINAMSQALDNACEYIDNSNEYNLDDFDKAYAELQQAIRDYRFSQTATQDSPADFTFLIKNPAFFNEDCGLAREDANNDNRSQWGTSSGWVNASVSNGGDFRSGFHAGRTCYNSWSNNFTSMDLHQDITDVPNGYYSLVCYGHTYSGQLTDQHAYIRSTAGIKESPYMTVDLGEVEEAWERLETPQVAVVDGSLTIGFASTSGGGTVGWWNATDFALFYHGESSEDELIRIYESRLDECWQYADAMHFAADRTALQQTITLASGKTSKDDINAALELLNTAMDSAKVSENAYEKLVGGQYATISTGLQESSYGADATPILTNAIAIVDDLISSEDATYARFSDVNTILSVLSGSYCTALDEAVAFAQTVSDQTARDMFLAEIKKQSNALSTTTELPSEETLRDYITTLSDMKRRCSIADLYAFGETDYTSTIINSTVDVAEVGWNYDNATGNQLTSAGNAYDGGSSRYHNSWNPTLGDLRYTAWQDIDGIPNGTYELKAMCRVMDAAHGAEGFYLYATPDGDTEGTVFKAVHTEQINLTKYMDPALTAADGGDSLQYICRTYGSVWCKAMDDTNMGEDVIEGSEEEKILNVNGGMGYGWQWNELLVEVTNHRLTIGVTCDSTYTLGHHDTDGKTCVPFSGSQISADNYHLTLLSLGDNTGWNPVTLIEETRNGGQGAMTGSIYTITGQKVSTMIPGRIYIVGRKKVITK